MSALTYCFYCHTPVNFINGKQRPTEQYNTVEGAAQCSKCGAVYRLTITMLREPERVDVVVNVSAHDKQQDDDKRVRELLSDLPAAIKEIKDAKV